MGKAVIAGQPVSRVCRVIVSGPLATFADGFRQWLLAVGYTPLSTVPQLQLMAKVSRWLEREELAVGAWTAPEVQRFLASRPARSARKHSAGLGALLRYLGELGVLPPAPPEPPLDAASTLVTTFTQYLRSERGLTSQTVTNYSWRVARFLARFAPDGNVAGLTAAAVTRMVLDERAVHSVGAAQHYAASLRAFTRFCYLHGLISVDLSAAALPVTGRRHWPLPRGLDGASAAALREACAGDGPVMLRDRAIMSVLMRLGLRAGEVAALRLEDIDWRAGQVTVRGKGATLDQLPLPSDVGAAIADYLRDARPATTRREVFVSVTAPVRAMTREAVACLVRRAAVRAGMPEVGPHRLRHTAACAMVAARIPLPQIGQVLRHRSHATTAGYARAGIEDLRTLAKPWPTPNPKSTLEQKPRKGEQR